MKSIILALTFLLALPQAFANQAEHTASDVAHGKIVVMRAKESSKTRNLLYSVQVDSKSLGKLKSNRSKEMEVAAGEYTLFSTLRNSESLVVNVQPGEPCT
jgi:hypothetical protein